MSEAVAAEPEMMDPPPAKGKGFDPGFVRNMKVIIGVVAIAFGIVISLVLALRGNSRDDTGVNVNAMNTGSVQTRKEDPTPAMQRKLEGVQQREAEEAMASGKTYIPKESIGATVPVAPLPAGPGPSTMQMNNAYVAPTQLDQKRVEGLRRQLDALFPSTIVSGSPRQSLEPDRNAQAAVRQAAPSGTPDAAATVKKNVVIPALEIVAGQMANPMNVGQGKTQFASARITAGKFAGAYLTGVATMTENESIEVAFKDMRIGNKAYKIDAIVLDEQTADSGLRGDVDRRILARYVLPMTVGFMQGYFKARSQTGTSAVLATGNFAASPTTAASAATAMGAVITTTPAPTMEQATAAGVAVGLQQAQSDVERNAALPIRSATNSGVPIGILFRTAVLEEVAQ